MKIDISGMLNSQLKKEAPKNLGVAFRFDAKLVLEFRRLCKKYDLSQSEVVEATLKGTVFTLAKKENEESGDE